MDSSFEIFLINAKKATYANSKIEKVHSSRLGSNDYHYEEVIDNKKYTYHDTYFDGIEQIYKDNNLIYELHCSGGIIE